MATSEHPEVIEGRRRLISTVFLILRRHLRMVSLIMMVLLRMKKMTVVWKRQLLGQVLLNQ